jgi:hypothetical protein
MVLLPFAVKLRKAGRRFRHGGRALLMLIACVALTTALALGLSGCGGGNSSGGSSSTPRNYALTLTATSGTYSQTTSLTLVVK